MSIVRSGGLVAGAIVCAGTAIALFVNWRPPALDIPAVEPIEDNTIDEMIAVSEKLRKAIAPYQPDPSSELEPDNLTPQQRSALLVDCRPILSEVHKVAGRPLRFSSEDVFSDLVADRMRGARWFAKAVATCAACYRLCGDNDSAANVALDIVETGGKLPRGGSLIEGLVGLAVESIGQKQLELAMPKMSGDGLSETAARLELLESEVAPFSEFLRAEGMGLARTRQHEFRQGGTLGRMWRSLCIPFEAFGEMPGVWWVPEAIRDGLKLLFTNKTSYIQAILDVLEKAALQASSPYNDFDESNEKGVVSVFVPRGAAAYAPFAKRDAVSALQRAQVAVIRYHRANGQYPSQLEDLVPEFIHRVPDDPFGDVAGAPLLYKLCDDGFILYSRGPDCKDDGGKWVPWVQLYNGGDMVAGRIFQPSPDE